MPIARPTMFASASGAFHTRCEPWRRCRLCVTLKTPPLPLTSERLPSREQSATSWPKTTTRGSRRISSLRHAFSRSTIVFGSPERAGSDAKAGERGSTSGGVDVARRARRLGHRRRERGLGGGRDLAVDLLAEAREALRR